MMRLKLKMTVRKMMVIVAIAAIAFAAWSRELLSRRADSLHSVSWNAQHEADERRRVENYALARRNGVFGPNDPSNTNWKWEKVAHLRLNHYAMLKAKYERAASHPWESVAPDPPDPADALAWEAMDMSLSSQSRRLADLIDGFSSSTESPSASTKSDRREVESGSSTLPHLAPPQTSTTPAHPLKPKANNPIAPSSAIPSPSSG